MAMAKELSERIDVELEKIEAEDRREQKRVRALIDSAAAALGGTSALAARLGVTRAAISAWRVGKRKLSPVLAKKIKYLASAKTT
jgi:transcriptional regulator with XRE-family HTH domain